MAEVAVVVVRVVVVVMNDGMMVGDHVLMKGLVGGEDVSERSFCTPDTFQPAIV